MFLKGCPSVSLEYRIFQDMKQTAQKYIIANGLYRNPVIKLDINV